MSIHTLRTYKEGLLMRIDKLMAVKEYFEKAHQEELIRIRSEVDNINIAGKKEALELLRSLSEQIMCQTEKAPAALIAILTNQRKEIKDCYDEGAKELLRDTESAIRSHTLVELSSQIRKNTNWIEEREQLLTELEGYNALHQELPSIPGLTDQVGLIMKSKSSIKEKLHMVVEVMNKINISTIIPYIQKEIVVCQKTQAETDAESVFYATCNEIIDAYLKVDKKLKDGADIIEQMKQLSLLDRHMNVIQTLFLVHKYLIAFSKKYDLLRSIEKMISKNEKSGAYARNAFLKNQDDEERQEMRQEVKELKDKVRLHISRFYTLSKKEWQALDIIEVREKREGGYFMKASLLVLLMADSSQSDVCYANLLGYNDNKVREEHRSLEGLIKQYQETLCSYSEQNPTSFAPFLLELLGNN